VTACVNGRVRSCIFFNDELPGARMMYAQGRVVRRDVCWDELSGAKCLLGRVVRGEMYAGASCSELDLCWGELSGANVCWGKMSAGRTVVWGEMYAGASCPGRDVCWSDLSGARCPLGE
jgi:hypothetical protein